MQANTICKLTNSHVSWKEAHLNVNQKIKLTFPSYEQDRTLWPNN